MTTNIGSIDRVLRIGLGAALIAWALGWVPGFAPSVWGWLGVIPLGTALIGSCPVYSLLGIQTCSRT
jgi:hypothetical protein